MNSPHIIKLHDIVEDSSFCHIVTEIYTGGTLKDHIQANGVFTEPDAI